MPYDRPIRILQVFLAVLATVFPAAVAALTLSSPAHAAIGPRPAFQMPFQCGTYWRLNSWDHAPALDIVREPQSQTGGSVVVASYGGTVLQAFTHSNAGNMVIINHGGGWYTLYIHLRDFPLVRAGQTVARGTAIGYVGQSGGAVSDHLHYEQLTDKNGDGYPDWGVDASQDGTGNNGEDVPVTFNGVTYTGDGGEWRNVQSKNCTGTTPPPPAPTKYWVDTFANAPVFASATSTTQTGTLYAGTNYVYCKVWGRNVGNATSYNHWWLKTDPDVGPANQFVSAYYLSRWGNDVAKDNNGVTIPTC